MLKTYEVVTGPMLYIDPITEDGRGPMETVYEVCYVTSRNKRDARKAAVRYWLRHCPRPPKTWWHNPCCYPHHQRMDQLNPFAGLKVTEVNPDVLRAYPSLPHFFKPIPN